MIDRLRPDLIVFPRRTGGWYVCILWMRVLRVKRRRIGSSERGGISLLRRKCSRRIRRILLL